MSEQSSNLAEKFLQEYENAESEKRRFTTTFGGDIVSIIDRWRRGSTSRKQVAERLIQIGHEVLSRRSSGAGDSAVVVASKKTGEQRKG